MVLPGVRDDHISLEGGQFHLVVPEPQVLEDAAGEEYILTGALRLEPVGFAAVGAADQIAAGPDLDGIPAVRRR